MPAWALFPLGCVVVLFLKWWKEDLDAKATDQKFFTEQFEKLKP